MIDIQQLIEADKELLLTLYGAQNEAYMMG